MLAALMIHTASAGGGLWYSLTAFWALFSIHLLSRVGRKVHSRQRWGEMRGIFLPKYVLP